MDSVIPNLDEDLDVDLFAGGGGASTGVEAATGKPVDIAINHDPIAIAVHERNHPNTRHLVKDVFEARPADVLAGRCVGRLWASPDCTDFSVAKGGKPRKQGTRSLAWAVVRWAELPERQRPKLIFVENVAEFEGWGPLDEHGKRIKDRVGETFRRWKRQLEALGYEVEHRVLDASMFGAPTRRKRLFVIARRDGQPIRWPSPTHGPGMKPCRTAAEIIDWTLPCPSIFERKKPLAEKTLWRIAQGLRRFVIENDDPFVITIDQQSSRRAETSIDDPLPVIVTKNRAAVITPHLLKVNHGKRDHRGERLDRPLTTVTAARRGHAVAAATLMQIGYGERKGQRARVPGVGKPLGTIVAKGRKHALVEAFLLKHYGDPLRTKGGGVVVGSSLKKPIGTVTSRDHHAMAAVTLAHFRGTSKGQPGSKSVRAPLSTISAGGIHTAEVRAFLVAYYGSAKDGQDLKSPLRTLTTKDRLGLVVIRGSVYEIVDIGMRMLEPHELLAAQFGIFAKHYDLGPARTKAAKVRLIGNSVCPEVARAVVAANLPAPLVKFPVPPRMRRAARDSSPGRRAA